MIAKGNEVLLWDCRHGTVLELDCQSFHLGPSFPCNINVGKSLNYSVPQFPIYKIRANYRPNFIGLLSRLNEIVHITR